MPIDRTKTFWSVVGFSITEYQIARNIARLRADVARRPVTIMQHDPDLPAFVLETIAPTGEHNAQV